VHTFSKKKEKETSTNLLPTSKTEVAKTQTEANTETISWKEIIIDVDAESLVASGLFPAIWNLSTNDGKLEQVENQIKNWTVMIPPTAEEEAKMKNEQKIGRIKNQKTNENERVQEINVEISIEISTLRFRPRNCKMEKQKKNCSSIGFS